jgi:peptidoglycan/xylan/chitin deacetylase (PgdA/CDA1 family)
VVPTLALGAFRAQLEALGTVGDVVDLEELAQPGGRARACRIALTFDDDYRCHVEPTLAELQTRSLPATFFLSGRALHGLGGYWWQVLEHDVTVDGVRATAARYASVGDTPKAIAMDLYGTPISAELNARGRELSGAVMTGEELHRLGRVARVGFHTLHHPHLPSLPASEAAAALHEGRRALAAATVQPLSAFAYPHGAASEGLAAAVRRAGFESAWTTAGGVTSPQQEPHRRSRWDPGARVGDDFVAAIITRLVRGRGL